MQPTMTRYIRRLVAALTGLGAFGCALNPVASGPAVPAPAANFSVTTLSGQALSLSAMKGKVVVVDFWATWCSSCQKSLPHLQRLASDAELAKKGLVVLAIDEGENPGAIQAFARKNQYTFAVGKDCNCAVGCRCCVDSLPTTLVVDRNGKAVTFNGWAGDQTAQQIDDAVLRALDMPAQIKGPIASN